MMFLLRLAFWLMVICLILPSSREENRRLMSSAERAVSDVRSFCERNPAVCEDAQSAFTNFLTKIKTGAEVLETWMGASEAKIMDRLDVPPASSPDSGVNRGGSPPVSPLQPLPRWGNSLAPGDKRPPWRDPARL